MNSENKLTEIIEGMSDIFFSLDKDWNIIHGNSQFFEYTKKPASEQLGKNFLDLYMRYPEADKSLYWLKYHEAMIKRVPVTFDDYYPPLDSWTRVHAKPSADGGLNIFARDISSEIMAEEALEKSETSFKVLADAMPQLAWIANPDGHIFWYNKGWYDYTGTTFKEMEGWGWKSVHHPDEIDRVMGEWKSAIEHKVPTTMQFPIKGADGKYRWFLTRVTPVFNSNGKVDRWLGTNTNVDDLKQAEDQIVGILESMSDAFFSVDQDWKITRVNQQHLKVTHLKREEQVGKNLLDLFFFMPEAKTSKYWINYHKVMQERVPVEFEEYYPPFDLWTLVRANPTPDGGMAVFFTDTTAQKKTSQKIEAEKNKFEAIFFDSPASMALLRGPTFIFEKVNAKYQELMGGRELRGKSLHEALPELIGQPFHDLMKKVYETGIPFDGKEIIAKLIRRPGGEPEDTYFDFTYSRIDDGEGNPYGIYIHAFDITEMVMARRQAEESSNKLQLALKAGHMGTWHTDLKTNLLTLSPEALDLFQIEKHKLDVHELINKMMHPEDVKRITQVLSEAIKNKTPYIDEYRIIRSDGQIRWLLAQGNVVEDALGHSYHSGVVQDITERKVAEEKIKEISFEAQTFRQTLHDVFMQSSAAIAICRGKDFVFELANIPYQQIVARKESDLIGRGIAEAIPELEQNVITAFQNVYASGEPFIVTELPATIAHGGKPTLGYYNLTVNPVFDSSGEVQRAVIIGYDVSEQVEARKKAEALLKELKDAVKARDEFLSIASHELKTPLTSLKLQAQIHHRAIKRSDPSAYDEEAVKDLVVQTEKQVLRLTRLVDDMLDVSRIRSGHLNIQREHFDLSALIEEVIERLKTQFKDAGYALPELSKTGVTDGEWDRMRIEQVITNLLTNAIRYGNKKPIKVMLESKSDLVRVIVHDNGIGVSDEAKPVIFDRFERAINANEVSGLGLGLFITKQIVTAHEGKIWVESEEGKGSDFIMDLPKHTKSKKEEVLHVV